MAGMELVRRRERILKQIVSVTIRKDGDIKINGIEKRSGNIYFDRSALQSYYKGPSGDASAL